MGACEVVSVGQTGQDVTKVKVKNSNVSRWVVYENMCCDRPGVTSEGYGTAGMSQTWGVALFFKECLYHVMQRTQCCLIVPT